MAWERRHSCSEIVSSLEGWCGKSISCVRRVSRNASKGGTVYLLSDSRTASQALSDV
jgi:hypothetical protein